MAQNNRITAKDINYIAYILCFLSGFFLFAYFFNSLFILINYLFYFIQTSFKGWLFLSAQAGHNDEKKYDSEISKLPVYSILVPMYKEEHGVKVILYHLSKLDYPINLLDIKLVVEEDDTATIRIIDTMDLPKHIEVIKVPYSLPRTKPKALNYAMQYIKGKYVVIYDVEDRPDSDQLIKAAKAFQSLPKHVICLQAKLNFYNKNQNLLSRLFSIEYSILFDFLLKALEKDDMPIPLGGNSNHFKVKYLWKLGLWDAYNVTEDADLGLRLFMHGYRTAMIDSYTLEESTTGLSNWLNQRSRWIKGFIQTFLVYCRQSPALKAGMSFRAKLSVYLFLGLGTYGFFILPWCVAALHTDYRHDILAWVNIVITLIYMYGAAIMAMTLKRFSTDKAKILDLLTLFIWPFYFILHSIAIYKAIWELLVRPFGWNKTEHAISRETNDCLTD